MTRILRVVAAAVCSGDRVLAAKRSASSARGGRWELPGGKVEPGESDQHALAREIREELGVGIEVGHQLAEVVHSYPELTIRLVCYVAATSGIPVAHEHEALRWVRPDELQTLEWADADLGLLEAVRAHLRSTIRTP